MGYPEQPGCPVDRPGVVEHVGQQLAIDLVVERVHLVVVVFDLQCRRFVPRNESVESAMQHAGRDLAHARDVDQRLQQWLVFVHEGDLRYALGVVSHALHVDDDVQGRHNGSQIGGHRLLGCD